MSDIKNSNYNRLLGKWETSGELITEQGKQNIKGIDSYKLILNNNFIVHEASVIIGKEKSETLEIIKIGSFIDEALMQYYNANGEEGQMKSSIKGNNFLIEGKGLKFIGFINNSNTLIEGIWYRKENEIYVQWINVKLKKVKAPA